MCIVWPCSSLTYFQMRDWHSNLPIFLVFIFKSISVCAVKVRNWQLGAPVILTFKRKWKNYFSSYSTDYKRQKLLCFFVNSEDYVKKVTQWTCKNLFYLICVAFFPPGVLGEFFVNVTLFLLFIFFFPGKEWPGRNVCGRVKFEDDG